MDREIDGLINRTEHIDASKPQKQESSSMSGGLTQEQIHQAVNRIWFWYERALAPRAAKNEIIKEGKKRYDIKALWKHLRNDKKLKRDLDALLAWVDSSLPGELKNKNTVQTMIDDIKKDR